MTGEQALSGRHVLLALIAFFGTVFIANFAFIYLAVNSFPGEHEEKSYLQGLRYNERLDQRAQQEALGWTASISRAELDDAKLVIEIDYSDDAGLGLSRLEVSGSLSRPVDDDLDQVLVFESIGAGRYRAYVEGTGFGVWRLVAVAETADGVQFELDTQIVVQ